MLKNGTKFIYRETDKETLNLVLKYLEDLPLEVKQGIKKVYFEDKKGEIAGVTKGTSITLYDFLTYDTLTQRHILYHEIGHTFANEIYDMSASERKQVQEMTGSQFDGMWENVMRNTIFELNRLNLHLAQLKSYKRYLLRNCMPLLYFRFVE